MEVGVDKVVRIGLLGFGTVGSSVYHLIQKERDEILQATGVDLRVVRILEKDLELERPGVPQDLFTDDYTDIVGDPSIDIVVELIGGVDPAGSLVEGALTAGKDVVTANKQLLATRGATVFDLAKQAGKQIRFEASVGGAIPIIKVMRESMMAADLHIVYGIVNGTTNYILSEMFKGAGDYEDTLAQAQELGYAEPDPTEDVTGADAAAKMAITASIAYHSRVTLDDVSCEGLENVRPEDVQYAREFGFMVKLVGAARLVDERVNVRVHPALLSQDHPLASINGVDNAVFLEGHVIDKIMLSGPGAGGVPTSSAVVSDIISIVSTDKAGFLQDCSCYKDRDFIPDAETSSAFFIRTRVEDRAGVLAQISSIFGEYEVSIESMIQKGHGDQAELVMITHPTIERDFFAAIEEVGQLSCCRSPLTTIRVL